jgi:DNA repair exonuclease SbcCD ATPase subunit
VALKKPSEYFKKDVLSVDNSIQELTKAPELNTFSDAFQSFKSNLSKIEVLSDFSETLDNYRVNIERVNHLSENIEDIKTEIQNLLKKEDLDRAMISQLLVVEQSIQEVQKKVKGINEKNLTEIRLDVAGLAENVNEFLDIEVPKYKKLILDSEFRTNARYGELEENVNQTLEGIGEFVDNKYQELTETLEGINEKSLSVILEEFTTLEDNFQKLVNKDKDNLKEFKKLSESVKADEKFQEELTEKVTGLHLEIVRNETHIKVQNKTLKAIQEEVRDTLSKIDFEEFEEKNYKLGEKIKYIEEVFEKFNEKEILTETLPVEPSSTKNKDPLTPLDQNFVTLDQLQDHYRLFINRIQQQLATIGGGGETRLKYLDDIVGIATNASVYDGKVLSYNHSIGKFEFITGGGGGNVAISITSTPPPDPQPGNLWYDNVIGRTFLYYQDEDGSQWVDASPSGVISGGDSTWIRTGVGIHTLSNVGIGTTDPTSALTVSGDVLVVGIVTATDFNSASDVKLKKNITVIDNPLDKIIRLEGVNFQWKETGKKSLGVIAQEVEKVLPELVSGEESKTVNYNGIIGLLIECVKKQQEEIDELKRLVDK